MNSKYFVGSYTLRFLLKYLLFNIEQITKANCGVHTQRKNQAKLKGKHATAIDGKKGYVRKYVLLSCISYETAQRGTANVICVPIKP